MIPALRDRLGRRDAVCDKVAIYMDAVPIALRPPELHDNDWNALCRRLCGVTPTVDKLVFGPPPEPDPAAWARMDVYMAGIEKSLFSAAAAESRRRRR